MKRILFALLLGVLMVPATFSGAMAAQAEIGDFHRFECNTPDGKRLKPKFGNIDGVLYVDLPAQSKDCHAAVIRRIALCGQNTSFTSNTQNQEYAGCLPIFEKQARECEVFFRNERAKCDTGAAGAAGTEAVDDAGQAAALSPKCSELPGSYPDVSGDNHAWAQCWQEIGGRPGCYVYRGHYHSGDSVRISGECRGGVVARGTLTIEWGGGGTSQGPFADSKRNGDWVVRFSGGNVGKGPYVDGKKNGRWQYRRTDGTTVDRCFRFDERVDCN